MEVSGEPVAHEIPKEVAGCIAGAMEGGAEIRVVVVDGLGAVGEVDGPAAGERGFEFARGLFEEGFGNGTGDDGGVGLDAVASRDGRWRYAQEGNRRREGGDGRVEIEDGGHARHFSREGEISKHE